MQRQIGPLMMLALVATCLHAPALQATTLKAEGARGDRSFEERCPPGSYIYGFKYRSGAWLDQIQIACRDPRSQSPGLVYGQPQGGGGGAPATAYCKAGSVVYYFGLAFTEGNRQVASLFGSCIHVHTRKKTGNFWVGNPGGGRSNYRARLECPDGEAAVHLIGNVGNHVNALGLVCERLITPQNQGPKISPPPPPPPQAIEPGTDRPGGDYLKFAVANAGECQAACGRNVMCVAWTWVKPGVQGPQAQCYLKKTVSNAVRADCCTSGAKQGSQPK